MFLQASNDYNIDLTKCIMIGDSYKDIVPANELGMSSLFVLSGNGKKDLHKFDSLYLLDLPPVAQSQFYLITFLL